MSRPIITLTSDWNSKSYYEGSVKGALLTECGDVNIVNISNDIDVHDISQAAFVVKNTYKFFPKDSIHIIAINSNYSNNQTYNLAKFNNQYFIGTDNGFFSLLFDNDDGIEPEFLLEIDVKQENDNAIFPELSIFPEIINKIIKKSPLDDIGKLKTDITKASILRPVHDETTITGHVSYIDSYDNIITNISKSMFDEIGKGRNYKIYVNSNSENNTISKITSKYSETKVGDLLAIFNSVGLLEVAIKSLKITQYLNLDMDSKIRIKFYD